MEQQQSPQTKAQGVDVDHVEFLKKSWDAFTSNPLELIVGPILALLTTILVITTGPVATGLAMVGLKAARGESVTIGDSFAGYGRFVPSLVASLLVFIIVLVGSILFIIPGIIAAVLLCWTFYYIGDDEQATSAEAMKASYRLSKANVGHVIITFVVVMLLNLLGHLLIIGWLVTMPISLVYVALVFDTIKGSVPDNPHHSPLP